MDGNEFIQWLQTRSAKALPQQRHKPLVMGIVNVTPDSFSDGGLYCEPEKACEQALTLVEEGADLLDIGAESSRPGARALPLEEELQRLIPVIEQIRQHTDIAISVDTYKPEVMRAAIQAGADIINDIYALQYPTALETAAALKVPVCLMHMLGKPQTMQNNPQYPGGLIEEMKRFFVERIQACDNAGLDRNMLLLDPGFGFGKTVQDNLQLIQKLDEFTEFNLPILLGVSRKSTIGTVLNKPINQRLIGGITLAVQAAIQGAELIRTHDVEETNQAMLMLEAVRQA